MQVQTFLQQISDERGPMQGMAAEVIERMNPADFKELMHGISCATAETWMEKSSLETASNHEVWGECPVCGFEYDLREVTCPEYGVSDALKDRHPVTSEPLDVE